ncbi:hypothetical protein PR048_032359 [Dryococelus australis]|uniref:Uncharacterized protein n=1 Tax=Dryococelus australis TaxID=614101 RepID=A0ABQ9G4V0_9NEOP|nr:hypothetical protein PR048_032359 [Dryococelus australis]
MANYGRRLLSPQWRNCCHVTVKHAGGPARGNEERRNVRSEETGNHRENPPTSGIFRHNSHLRKSWSDPTGQGLNPVRIGRRLALNRGPLEFVARRIISGSILHPERNISLPLVTNDARPELLRPVMSCRRVVIGRSGHVSPRRQHLGSPCNATLKLVAPTSGVDVRCTLKVVSAEWVKELGGGGCRHAPPALYTLRLADIQGRLLPPPLLPAPLYSKCARTALRHLSVRGFESRARNNMLCVSVAVYVNVPSTEGAVRSAALETWLGLEAVVWVGWDPSRSKTHSSAPPPPPPPPTCGLLASRSARLPPRRTGIESLGGLLPYFCIRELYRTMPLVGEFSRGSPVSPAPSFRRYSILTSITLIGSQDLAVKSSPNLFSHSLYGIPLFSSAGMKGRGKREIPEKTRRPTASSGTIITCEIPGATPPGIEPGSRRWKGSSLATAPPWPR